jgi:hypothetical protein
LICHHVLQLKLHTVLFLQYISPSDNCDAGSCVSNQLDKYPDRTMVEFVVK